MPDIFISYSSKDREQAQLLTELLASAGLSVWIDQSGIGAATSWSGEISKAITDCKALIVLLSPSSVDSKNVTREVALAFERNKKILPIDLEPVALPDDFAYHLAGLQRASIANIDSIIRALDLLAPAIDHGPGVSRAPSPIRRTSRRAVRRTSILGTVILVSIVALVLVIRRPWSDSAPLHEGLPDSLKSSIPRANELYEMAAQLGLDQRDSMLRAEVLYRRAIAEDPKFGSAYAALAATQLQLAQEDTSFFQKANLNAEEARALPPSLAKPYVVLTAVLDREERYSDAVRMATKGLEHAPHHSLLWNKLAREYERLGKDSLAETCFLRSIDVDANTPAYENAAMSMATWHHWEKLAKVAARGIPLFDSLQRALPNDYAIQFTLLLFYHATDDLRERTVLQHLKDFPSTPTNNYNLGWFFAVSGSEQDALSYLKRCEIVDRSYLAYALRYDSVTWARLKSPALNDF